MIGIAISISYTTETQGVTSLTHSRNNSIQRNSLSEKLKIVPFAKIMEPAFAEDYVDTDITTEVANSLQLEREVIAPKQ